MTITAESPSMTTGITSPRITVIAERCAGCQECVIRCPVNALSMDTDSWIAVGNNDLCVGCRQCERTCPFSSIWIEGPLMTEPRITITPVHPAKLSGDNSEIKRGIDSWEKAVTEAARCLNCPDPTCVKGCPAHNDIPAFIKAIREKNLNKAHEILSKTSMMPDICSRVCDWATQCEGACTWTLAGGQGVSIGALERFITDNQPVPPPVSSRRSNDGPNDGRAGGGRHESNIEASVAVVGSGPGGLAAAWELIANGVQVTMFEKDAEPLGILRWGIPSFTLPDNVAKRPIEALLSAGMKLNTSVEIHPEDTKVLLKDYDAIVFAYGAQLPIRLPVEGSTLLGVEDATSFLERTKSALSNGTTPDDIDESTRVLVIGAGNTAMDAARYARRFGASATAVEWMDRRFAKVRSDELQEALNEGVNVLFSTTVKSLEGDSSGKVTKAWLVNTIQKNAASMPKVQKTPPSSIEVDKVIMALGYRVDGSFAEKVAPGTPVRLRPEVATSIPPRRWLATGIFSAPTSPVGRMSLARDVYLQTSAAPIHDRVWVVGDALTGPATVVAAMAQGKQAAKTILSKLG